MSSIDWYHSLSEETGLYNYIGEDGSDKREDSLMSLDNPHICNKTDHDTPYKPVS